MENSIQIYSGTYNYVVYFCDHIIFYVCPVIQKSIIQLCLFLFGIFLKIIYVSNYCNKFILKSRLLPLYLIKSLLTS